jgi:acetyl/propionyl-CoA carboxylase alpha subunit
LEVSVYYDPLLAKLCTWGATREEALDRMRRALRELVVLGPTTNAALHQWILGTPDFQSGAVDTGWLERVWPMEYAEQPDPRVAALSVVVDRHGAASAPRADVSAEGDGLSPWQRAGRMAGMRAR